MGVQNLRVFLKWLDLLGVSRCDACTYSKRTREQAWYMSFAFTRPCLRLRSRWGRRLVKSAMNEAEARCSLTSSSSPALISFTERRRFSRVEATGCCSSSWWMWSASHVGKVQRVHLTPRCAFSRLPRVSAIAPPKRSATSIAMAEGYRDYLAARVLTENKPVSSNLTLKTTLCLTLRR
jgi:hypothetical protein